MLRFAGTPSLPVEVICAARSVRKPIPLRGSLRAARIDLMTTVETLDVAGRAIAVSMRGLDRPRIVVLCHGLHSALTGDHFDALSAGLDSIGLGTLRFDQYGNGASGGTPADRRFDDWVSLTIEFIHRLQGSGHEVSVVGNSMGGSAALVAAACEPSLAACVAWVPGLDAPPPRGSHEMDFVEHGEVMSWAFWEQYERADTLRVLGKIRIPTLVLLATSDDHSRVETRASAREVAAPPVRIELLEGYRHARWSEDQVASVIRRTVDFLLAI